MVRSMLKEGTQLGGGPIERLKGEHYEQEMEGLRKKNVNMDKKKAMHRKERER